MDERTRQNSAAWGNATSPLLLINSSEKGASHSLIIGGSGTFMSARLVLIVIDQKGET